MEWSLLPIFVVNVAFNSFLSFIMLSSLLLIALFLLKIKNPRVRAVCLMLPFIKILVDLSTYQFSSWALAQNVNPLMMPEGSRMLSASFMLPPFLHLPLCSIDFRLNEGQTFTLADIFCLSIGPQWTFVCSSVIIGGSLIFFIQACRNLRHSQRWFRKMLVVSVIHQNPIQDPILKMRMQRKQAVVYLSSIPHAPCIFGQRKPAIFIPRSLFEKLSNQEFEAIVAHELSHLEQGDLLAASYLFWFSYLFWWIPAKFVRRRLELAQEMACDRLLDTRLENIHLAEALVKSSQWLHTDKLPSCARPLATPHQIIKRLHALLEKPKKEEPAYIKIIKLGALLCWMGILFFGKFWTF